MGVDVDVDADRRDRYTVIVAEDGVVGAVVIGVVVVGREVCCASQMPKMLVG